MEVGVISVGLITERNSLVIDNIQGSFNTGIGTIGFNNGSTSSWIGWNNWYWNHCWKMLEVV